MKINNHSLLISIDHLLEDKMRNINGENFLLDFEVAELLLISTKDLIRKVRANKDRFPADLLTKISPKKNSVTLPQSEKRRKILYAFTLSGIMMVAGLFKTARANQISIQMVEFICERYGGMEKILEMIGKT